MGRIIKESASNEVKKDFTKDNSYVEVAPSSIRLSDNEVLGYRFVIDEKDYNDKYRFVDYENKKYNMLNACICNDFCICISCICYKYW